MKVLVTGGREYSDYIHVRNILREIHLHEGGISLIIQGGASGADLMASEWANENCIPCLNHPANWQKFGRSAGPIRNAAMLQWKPDLVVAFPGGSGTASMVNIAKGAGIEVRDLREPG